MLKNRWTTRQLVMAGIVLVFVLTLLLGNYGIYTHINHQRYVIKDELMDDIEENVERLSEHFEEKDKELMLYKSWLELQFSGEQSHSIIEDVKMTSMAYDEELERTYNTDMLRDDVGVLMLYDGMMKNIPSALRVEMNILFEGYENEKFLYSYLTEEGKVILNSSYGYTSILPYDQNIDSLVRGELVDAYEAFNNLSTAELKQWTTDLIPGDKAPYMIKTVALEGGASDRYLCTLMKPVYALVESLHVVNKPYELYVLDGQNNMVIKNFQVVMTELGESKDFSTILESPEALYSEAYPLMKKVDDAYIIGHPIEGTDWKVLALVSDANLGKSTLFKTSGFYLLNILFICIFAFLVIVVNRHLTELEK